VYPVRLSNQVDVIFFLVDLVRIGWLTMRRIVMAFRCEKARFTSFSKGDARGEGGGV
jgi:hypothetical protein